jgi:hypothetical protein
MSNSNSNSNEWRTVGSRRPEAPAAFGRSSNGEGVSVDKRREYDRANAEAEAARTYRDQKAKRDVVAKEQSALAFASESAYPSLSGGGGTRAVHNTTMNFSKTVADMAEREREAAILMQRDEEEVFDADEFYASGIRRRAQLGTRCYDNGPSDYNGPEEIEDEYDEGENDVEDEENAGEFNAHLAAARRRGDNGIW